jgi:hypothetical protein
MRSRRGLVASLVPLALAFCLTTQPALAQETTFFPPPERLERPGEAEASDRLGLLHVGPFWVTPSLRIGRVMLDTNVFYDGTSRTTDITGSVGPGLDIVLPIKSTVRLYGSGYLDYIHYVETEELRRWTGGAAGGLEYDGPRLLVGAEHAYREQFQRPNEEVDERVSRVGRETRIRLQLKSLDRYRFSVRTDLGTRRIEFRQREGYRGADLGANLNRDVHFARLELGYRLTPKTSFVLGGEHEMNRFLVDVSRDADSNPVYAGFEIDSQTRLGGRAVGGVRLFRPVDPTAGRKQVSAPYADVRLQYALSPKTRLELSHHQDLQYSAFQVSGDSPTRRHAAYELRLIKGLFGRLDLWVWGRLTQFETDGEITVVNTDGSTETRVRSDRYREAGANLGYRFRENLRVGISAGYTRRASNFSDLGFDGLLIGATVTYTPPSFGGRRGGASSVPPPPSR